MLLRSLVRSLAQYPFVRGSMNSVLTWNNERWTGFNVLREKPEKEKTSPFLKRAANLTAARQISREAISARTRTSNAFTCTSFVSIYLFTAEELIGEVNYRCLGLFHSRELTSRVKITISQLCMRICLFRHLQ